MLEFVITVVRVAKLCRLAKLQCMHEQIILIYTIRPARYRSNKNGLYTYQHLSKNKSIVFFYYLYILCYLCYIIIFGSLFERKFLNFLKLSIFIRFSMFLLSILICGNLFLFYIFKKFYILNKNKCFYKKRFVYQVKLYAKY